jgi:hypothetical protein
VQRPAATHDDPNRAAAIHEQLRLSDERDAWRCARWSRRVELARKAAVAAAAWIGVLMMPGALVAGIPQDLLSLVSGLLGG